MALKKRPLVDVEVPICDADREMAEGVGGDVDAAGDKTVALHRYEGSVVADDVGDRIRHRHVASSSAIVRDARPTHAGPGEIICHVLASHSSGEAPTGRAAALTPVTSAEQMRAAGITALGEPVEIFEVDEPAPPAAGEVLINVVAAGIGNWDDLVRLGSWQIGGPAPMALGTGAAGTGAAGGSGVAGLREGGDGRTH